jgi:hypothetical protein
MSAQPGVFTAIGDGISKFFGAKPPYDKLEEFSKLDVNLQKTKDNAEAFKAFAEAMGMWGGVGGRVSGGSSGATTGGSPQVPTDIKKRDDPNLQEAGKPVGTSSDMNKYLKSIALIESGGDKNAKAGTSSAGGMFQFIDSTWKANVKEMGKDYSLEDKFDPKKAAEVAEYFSNKQKGQMEKGLGRGVNNTDMYMGHFLGASGATKFLKAKDQDPSQSAAALDRNAAGANKNIYYDKSGRERSVKEVYELMDKKVKGAESALVAGKWGKGGISEDVANITAGGGSASAVAKETGKEVAKAIANPAVAGATSVAGAGRGSYVGYNAAAEAASDKSKPSTAAPADDSWMLDSLQKKAANAYDSQRSPLNIGGSVAGATDIMAQQRAQQQAYYAQQGKSFGGNAPSGGMGGPEHTNILSDIKSILGRQTEIADQHLSHARHGRTLRRS